MKRYYLVEVDTDVVYPAEHAEVFEALDQTEGIHLADVTDLVRTESQHTLPGEVYLGGICELR